MCGFDHAMILSPHFPQSQQGTPGTMTPICVYNTTENPRGTSRNIGWGCAACFLKPLPYFRPKSVIFPTLFQT